MREMEFKIANRDDVDGVLKLQFKYHVDSINKKDRKDGFVTTSFTKEQLTELVEKEKGLFIALKNGEIVAYLMAASWGYWSEWPMFKLMIKDLPKLHYLGNELSVKNSYQYGPICIDKSVRGTGLLEKLFDFSREEMSKKYPILVTFVNKGNSRSVEAHIRKLGLTVIHEFDFNNNSYFELAYDTSKKV
jgi:hypothetical protein